MFNKDKKSLSLLERYGLRYMKNLRKKQTLDRVDVKAYILDYNERAEINRIEKKAIINVIWVGVISSLISGLAGFFADPLLNDSADLFSEDNVLYWTIVIGVTILASLIEIFYIYYDIMSKSHALTKAAHLELFVNNNDKEDIASSIVRAALELHQNLLSLQISTLES